MSIRILTPLLSQEQLHNMLKCLHFTAERSYFVQEKDMKAPVDAYLYNQAQGYIDVPFMFGKLIYKGINPNQFMNKTRIQVNMKSPCKNFDQATAIQEAKIFLQSHEAVLLQARPGFGKTFCSIDLATQYGYTTIAIVNRRALLKQWKDTVLKHTNGSVWVVGEPVPQTKVDFIITMIDALNKIDASYLGMIGTVILDEAHMLCTPKQIPSILRLKPVKLILCTATPDRDARTTKILNTLVSNCRVVRRYTGFLKVIKFYTGILIDPKLNKRAYKGKKGIDWTDYVQKQQWNAMRNQQIVQWVKMNAHKKILVMTWGQKHAPHLCDLMKKEGVKVDFMSGNKKAYEDGQVLVGSFGKIGTGFDPSANEGWDEVHFDLLLLVGTTKSLALLEQLWGRAFRSEKPHIVVFIDDHKKAEGHFKGMKKLIKLYEADLVETQKIITIQ